MIANAKKAKSMDSMKNDEEHICLAASALTRFSRLVGQPPELENAPAPNQRAIRTEQFRTVCDTMVQGLGKKLRSIGADTVILGERGVCLLNDDICWETEIHYSSPKARDRIRCGPPIFS